MFIWLGAKRGSRRIAALTMLLLIGSGAGPDPTPPAKMTPEARSEECRQISEQLPDLAKRIETARTESELRAQETPAARASAAAVAEATRHEAQAADGTREERATAQALRREASARYRKTLFNIASKDPVLKRLTDQKRQLLDRLVALHTLELLDGMDDPAHSVIAGKWAFRGNDLSVTSGAGVAAGIVFPTKLPDRFALKISLVGGNVYDWMVLAIPIGNEVCTVKFADLRHFHRKASMVVYVDPDNSDHPIVCDSLDAYSVTMGVFPTAFGAAHYHQLGIELSRASAAVLQVSAIGYESSEELAAITERAQVTGEEEHKWNTDEAGVDGPHPVIPTRIPGH